MLTACLALVRPVGMADAEIEDWLGAAGEAVGQVPIHILDRACLEARRTCTHHSQIVPAVVREADRLRAEERSLAEARGPVRLVPPERQLPSRKLTQADVDAMSPEIIRIGLTCGALIKAEDGTVSVAPDEAA